MERCAVNYNERASRINCNEEGNRVIAERAKILRARRRRDSLMIIQFCHREIRKRDKSLSFKPSSNYFVREIVPTINERIFRCAVYLNVLHRHWFDASFCQLSLYQSPLFLFLKQPFFQQHTHQQVSNFLSIDQSWLTWNKKQEKLLFIFIQQTTKNW